jgi:hypothetical protein
MATARGVNTRVRAELIWALNFRITCSMIAKDIGDELETEEEDFQWRLEVTPFSFSLWYTN